MLGRFAAGGEAGARDCRFFEAHREKIIAASIDAVTVWLNDRAVVHDEFEEGGCKQSGIGRLNESSSIDDFIKTKHIVHQAGITGRE